MDNDLHNELVSAINSNMSPPLTCDTIIKHQPHADMFTSQALDVTPTDLNGIFDLCADENKRDTSEITRVSQLVKEQFVTDPYAKISASQQITAENNSDHLICGFTNHVIPKDLADLMCAYYPSFYYNDDFISLQSNHKNANIFVISKGCGQLSGYLSACINNQCAPTSIVKVERIEDDILELFVKYIANKYDKGLYRCKSEMESEYFDAICHEWDRSFAALILYEKIAQKLLNFAKRMDCESLVSVTGKQLKSIQKFNETVNEMQQKLLEHFGDFL